MINAHIQNEKIYNPDFEQTKYANYKTNIYGIFNKVYMNRGKSNFKDLYVKC